MPNRLTRHLRRMAAMLLALSLPVALAGCDSTDSLDSLAGDLQQYLNSGSGDSPSYEGAEWSLEQYPDYYAVAGEADFTGETFPDAGTIRYGEPDALGRSTASFGAINKELRDSGSDRDRDMPDEITGWPEDNPRVEIDFGDGDAYHGYLFNRSHLIAKSLGGEDSARNMVTGTRTENVGRNQPPGGMAYTETLARDWLDDNPDGLVYYLVTPVYEGDELLPRTVEVDIRTSDQSINQHVIVFNAANGFTIDYSRGGVL